MQGLYEDIEEDILFLVESYAHTVSNKEFFSIFSEVIRSQKCKEILKIQRERLKNYDYENSNAEEIIKELG